jgi:hypothetical protein
MVWVRAVAEVLETPLRLVTLELKVPEDLPSRIIGALAGLVGAGALAVAKMIAEWGRPEVKVATGVVDTALGAFIVYNQFVAGRRPEDPLLDTALSTFGILDLVIGLAALISGITGLKR